MVEPLILDKPGLFLVEVKVKGDSRNMRVQVLVDGDDGIDIDQCASISRQLGHQLEEEDVIGGKYILEVSSPGLDQPLRLVRQYVKNIDRELKIKTKDGEKLKALLLDVVAEKLALEKNDGQTLELPITEIEEAKVIVSFK
jgi:ribosome maturation factor RimP